MTTTATVEVTRVHASRRETLEDVVAVEEPLEIVVAWTASDGPRETVATVTMRTPGDDGDLATGFLVSEGVIGGAEEIAEVREWGSPNRVRVALRSKPDLSRVARNFHSTASCGVCGKTSIDAVSLHCVPLIARVVDGAIVQRAARVLDGSSFRATGGVHGAAIVDSSGSPLALREDIGRHNAVDKVIGAMLRERRALDDTMLVVSSRAGFEIVQKAIVARVPALISIGAPSSLAIDLARRFNLALIGFVREGRFNLYAGTLV